MGKSFFESSYALHFEQAFNELCIVKSLINILKLSCEDKEFRCKYYDIAKNKAILLSEERNEYINILSVASEKISRIIKLYLQMEKDKTLEQNPDYSSRKITTERTANERP